MLVLLTAVHAVAGCTTAAMSVGTPEEEIIKRGTTAVELKTRLGEPIAKAAIEPALRAWDIRKEQQRVTLLVEPQFVRLPDGKYEQVLPQDIAVELCQYKFIGRLKRKHDTGEAVSLALMTLGMSEVLFAPAALAAKANEELHVLDVWLDARGGALAYRWTRVAR